MILRPAESSDLPAITKLLAAAALPTAGIEDHLDSFIVLRTDPRAGAADSRGSADGGELVGVGGLEIHGRFALMRSVAVEAEHRRKGIASKICARLEAEAAGRGIDRIYLMAETAESFFAERGYSVIARTAAPVEIAATEEFTTLCPDSAVLMVRAC